MGNLSNRPRNKKMKQGWFCRAADSFSQRLLSDRAHVSLWLSASHILSVFSVVFLMFYVCVMFFFPKEFYVKQMFKFSWCVFV